MHSIKKLIISGLILILFGLQPNTTSAVTSPFVDRTLPETSPLTIPRQTIDTGPIRSDSVIIRHKKTIDIGTGLHNVAYSPSGDKLATYSGRLHLFETDNYTSLTQFPKYSGNDPLIFSANGQFLYNPTGHLRWGFFWTDEWAWIETWDTKTGEKVNKIGGEEVILGLVRSLALHPSGNYLAVGDQSGEITLWKIQNWKLIDRLEYVRTHSVQGAPVIGSLAFTPDGDHLLACCYESEKGNVIEWTPRFQGDTRPVYQRAFDMIGGKTADREQIHRYLDISGLSDISPNGQTILTSGHYRRSQKEWDRIFWGGVTEFHYKTGDTLNVYPPPKNYFKTKGSWRGTGPIYSNNQRLILSSGRGKRYFSKTKRGDVLIWIRKTKDRLPILRGHAGRVRDIAYHPTRDEFATASQDGTIKIWTVTFPENAWD